MLNELLVAFAVGLLIYCVTAMIFYAVNKNKIVVNDRFHRYVQKPVVELDITSELAKERKNRRKSGAGSAKISKIQQELESAGVLLRDIEYIAIWFAVTFVPSGLMFLLGGKPIAVFTLAAVGFCIPPLIVRQTKNKRLSTFEKQLGSSLLIIGNCLRAGFSFVQAMDSIATEMPDPIAGEFRRSLRELQLGVSMEDSFASMVRRVGSRDLDLLMTSVVIQRQTGGNLIDVIESISETIRDRLRIKSEVRVLTAQGRMSGIVVGLLPVFVLAFFSIINPTYVEQFFADPIGTGMLIVAVILETLGFLVVRKIVNIKY